MSSERPDAVPPSPGEGPGDPEGLEPESQFPPVIKATAAALFAAAVFFLAALDPTSGCGDESTRGVSVLYPIGLVSLWSLGLTLWAFVGSRAYRWSALALACAGPLVAAAGVVLAALSGLSCLN